MQFQQFVLINFKLILMLILNVVWTAVRRLYDL